MRAYNPCLTSAILLFLPHGLWACLQLLPVSTLVQQGISL